MYSKWNKRHPIRIEYALLSNRGVIPLRLDLLTGAANLRNTNEIRVTPLMTNYAVFPSFCIVGK